MINIDNILPKVQKPARYTGGELGCVMKNKDEVDIRFAFCFPDTYEIGMSHLGMKILYHMMNERTDTWVERVFAPWNDMEACMRSANIPLYGLESGDPIASFDILGFTLQYEMSYTNIINMLDLAGIPLTSKDRGNGIPFVCAGGPCAFNPEPLADFIDFYLIGEGEEITNEVLDVYKEWKKASKSREEFLYEISKIEGVYVPSFYSIDYNEDGTLKAIVPLKEGLPTRIKKRIIKDLDSVYYPDKFIVPFIEIVHDRIMLEIFRGCMRGCRFCQAGIIYRPVRERSVSALKNAAQKLMDSTGYDEMSLTSLSTSDYTDLGELTDNLLEITTLQKVNLALPSLRVDNFTIDLMNKVQTVRKSGLTFAPEAGTQRMRDVINKGVEESDLLRSCKLAFEGGWSNLKLYFMIGLPTETNEDVEGIANLAYKVLNVYNEIDKSKRSRKINITVSVSSFVPKPFTPFEWEAQDTIEKLKEKQAILTEKIRSRNITFNFHVSYVSNLEGVFARGDRRLGKVLLTAHRLGCKFDGWDEFFSYNKWLKAFEECGVSIPFYANRERKTDEILPWDIIDCGVKKEFLIREKEKAYKGEITENCREKCSACGANISFNTKCQDGGCASV